MADNEHVKIVKKGTESIAKWRAENPDGILNLFKARLPNLNLTNANFNQAFMPFVDLTNSKCARASFFTANLSFSNMHFVDLSYANLAFATLKGAILSNSDLTGANLSSADLSYIMALDVNLHGVTMTATNFSWCDLNGFIGLETVEIRGPVNIDFNTLLRSFRQAGNQFTSPIRTFLLNTGIAREFVDELPRILGEVKYYNSFVCYGQPDRVFAKKLVEGLRGRGASCWLYSLDSTVGRRTWEEIGESRRRAEKMIVLCSAKSLIRDGVLKEIEEQIDEDPNKIIPISLDNLWKEEGFIVKRGQRDLKPFLLDKNYADFSEESNYDDPLSKLLNGLRRK